VHIVDILQQWSENNVFFIWLRESPSLWAYPAVYFVHTLALTFTAGASLVIDARLLGAARQLPIPPLARLFKVIWTGVAVTVLSGVIMLVSDLQTRLANSLFPMKMTFVLAAMVLTLAMRRRIAEAGVDSTVSSSTRVLALASLVSWLGAVASGKFAAYF
jgi:hypothetical protein